MFVYTLIGAQIVPLKTSFTNMVWKLHLDLPQIKTLLWMHNTTVISPLHSKYTYNVI